MPFLNKTLDLRTGESAPNDIRVVTLLQPLDYISATKGKHYRVMAGTNTDGLSIPKPLQGIISPHGKGAWSGYLHDGLYHESVEEKCENGGWCVPVLTKEDKDLLLREALLGQGFSEIDVDLIFEGVNWGGDKAFQDDLSLPIPR